MTSISEYSLDLSFPGGDSGKEPIYQSRRHKRRGFDPWVGKIPPGGGNGRPLQYSCLENPMDKGAWWATVHRGTKSQTQLKWLTTENLFGLTRHKKSLEGYSKFTSEFRNDLLCMGSSGREYQRNMALCVNQHLLNHPWLLRTISASLCCLQSTWTETAELDSPCSNPFPNMFV